MQTAQVKPCLLRRAVLPAMALLLLAGCKSKTDMTTDNPFFSPWDTPYGIPDFGRIGTAHYMPAFEEGMRRQKAEIAAIVADGRDPDFANTCLAYEYSGELLHEVSAVFFNLAECESSDAMDAVAEEVTPLLTAHEDDIALDSALFARVRSVYERRAELGLGGEQLRLVEEQYKGFVRAGANVPPEQQPRFRQLNGQIASLTLRFAQNVLHATNAYGRTLDDGTTVTLQMPSWEPFMQNCADRALREEVWRAYTSRCSGGEWDNTAIIDSLVNLRLERARLLGYETHADYVLADCLAGSPGAVYKCLLDIWPAALRKACEERDTYQQMLEADHPGERLQPWDWRYYAERVRERDYALDDSLLRPYFPLDSVREGAFMVARRLYGLTFVERTDLPIYNAAARAFEVRQADSTLGILYMDFHPRASKRSGAWMTEFRGQHRTREGANVMPVIQVVCNFTPPADGRPSLLNFDECETLFHEFGHALHGLLSRCTYPSLAGTNVPRDFVELPSQVMENWCRHPQVMRLYARHYLTGEPIADSLVDKIVAAQTYGQGFSTTELLAASLLDMDYHTLRNPRPIDALRFEEEAMQRVGLIPEIISRYRSPYFQHIFTTGYDAGYYSYTWTAILDADAFSAFEEKGDLFDPELAARFRRLLESGNTVDPMTLYRQFRGRDPEAQALLRRKGLI